MALVRVIVSDFAIDDFIDIDSSVSGTNEKPLTVLGEGKRRGLNIEYSIVNDSHGFGGGESETFVEDKGVGCVRGEDDEVALVW